MDWAIAIEGRTDPEAILLLFAERSEAEAVARQMRRSSRPAVCVRPFYTLKPQMRPAGPPTRPEGSR